MKRRSLRLAAAVLGCCTISPIFAQEYQQALPDDPAVSATTNTASDSAPQPLISNHASLANKAVIASASDSQMAVLMSKVMQLNKDVSVYQQNTMQRIDNLKDSELQLQQHLQKLQQIMQLFDKQVQQLQTAQKSWSAAKQGHQSAWVSTVEQQWGTAGLYAAMAAILLMLMVLIWRVWPRAKVSASPSSVDSQSEFDFMATSEAIPAKLDLARAYLAMDDLDSARGVLSEVLNKGSVAQKQQAQDVMKEIESKQQARSDGA